MVDLSLTSLHISSHLFTLELVHLVPLVKLKARHVQETLHFWKECEPLEGSPVWGCRFRRRHGHLVRSQDVPRRAETCQDVRPRLVFSVTVAASWFHDVSCIFPNAFSQSHLGAKVCMSEKHIMFSSVSALDKNIQELSWTCWHFAS